MSEGTELGRFLRARRGQVRPQDVGLPAGTGIRRTPDHDAMLLLDMASPREATLPEGAER